MATYVSLYRFTEQGIRNIKESPARIEKVKELFRKHGATIKEFYALMGEYDTVIVAEAPSDEVMVKLNLTLDSWGHVTSQTMRAFTENEYKKMVQEMEVVAEKKAA